MAKYTVIADKLWHSGECRMCLAGEVIELPDGTKSGGAVQLVEDPKPAKPAKAKADPDNPIA